MLVQLVTNYLGDLNLDTAVLLQLVSVLSLNIVCSSYTFFMRLGKGVVMMWKYRSGNPKEIHPGQVAEG